MSWIRTGTVTVTNNSAAVVGSGTLWLQTVNPGDTFFGPDRSIYEVLTVNSDTSITLASNYLGSSLAGGAYAIYPTQDYVRVAANQLRELQLALGIGTMAAASTPVSGAHKLLINQVGVNRAVTLDALLGSSWSELTTKAGRWDFGPSTPVAGATMKIDNLFESSSFPLAAEAGIWAQQTYTAWAFSHEFTAASVPAAGGSPLTTGFFYANNNGSPGDVVALIASAIARTSGGTVFGANILARNSPGNTNTKLVGLEIDLQPTAGTTVAAGTAGLYINGFNLAMTANAIQIGGVGGGSFSDGLVIGGVTGAGVSPNGSTTMASLLNSGLGVFTDAAIVLSNGHKMRLKGTGSVHAHLYNDGSNNVRLVPGSGGRVVFRDTTDLTSLVSLFDSGGQGVVNIETSGGEYRVNGVRVLGARITGWGIANGAVTPANYDASTATPTQTNQALAALINACRSHGFINT